MGTIHSIMTRKRPVPEEDSSEDVDTNILVAEMLLEDIQNSRNNRSSQPECYVDFQIDSLRDALQQLKNKHSQVGSSSKRGRVEKTRATAVDPQALLKKLGLLAQAGLDDHLAALALSRGEPLPPQTEAQKALENALLPETARVKEFLKNTEPATRAMDISEPAVKRVSAECIICGDSVDTSATFQAHCSHGFCRECVINMVKLASRDEELLPLRCCESLLPVDPLLKFVPHAQRVLFRDKLKEVAIPPPERVYCPKESCSTFIGQVPKRVNSRPQFTCSKCKTKVCTACRNITHPGDDCKQNALALQAKQLAKEKKWQTCPGCKMIVERIAGCPNMVCRCGQQFCYCCGASKGCNNRVHGTPITM